MKRLTLTTRVENIKLHFLYAVLINRDILNRKKRWPYEKGAHTSTRVLVQIEGGTGQERTP